MVGTVWISLLGILVLSSCALAVPRYSCSSSEPSWEIDAKAVGEIVSPGFPVSYSNNNDCTWKLKAPLGSVVRVTITQLNLDKSDFLTISDGETSFAGNLFGKYSMCMKGELSLFSTGQYMLIQFKADGSGNNAGFKIEYKAVRKSQIVKDGKVNIVCPFHAVFPKPSGYIAHPGFPGPVTLFKSCSYEIRFSDSSRRPYISFKMFGLKPDPGFCYDSVVKEAIGSRQGKYCGCKLPKNAKSNSQNAYLQLKARRAGGIGQPGFLVYYKDIDTAKCPNPTKCDALNDDRNIGFDRNANIMYEKKVVTTTLAPTTTPAPTPPEPVKPFQVKCDKDRIEIALKSSEFGDGNFQTNTATLVDSNCKAERLNDTHVYMSTPLDGCGTVHNYSSDGRYVIYYNHIALQRKSKEASALITRDHEAVFEFECRYHRRIVMSVVHFTPARATVYTTTENFGNFTFMMRMFKSKKYKEAYEKYPVYAIASKELYVQTEVKAEDAELVLLVEKCHVTPSKDRNDKEFYDLIEEGCSKDETLEYNHKLSPVQRFNFKAFYFNVDKKATVHIHCKVRVCRKADKKSRCVEGCPYSRRRRAAASDADDDEITGSLTLGPVFLQEESQSGRSTGSESPKMFVEIVVGVLGFFVVVLLVAVMVVLLKKRQQQTKKHLSLMIDDSEQ